MNNKEVKTFNYWCKNNCKDCKICDQNGMLQINVEVEVVKNNNKMPTETFLCPSKEEEMPLKLMGQSVPSTKFVKMSSEEIKRDRMKRSKTHFEKEVFDTLPKSYKKDFKYNDKLSKRLK